MKIMELIQAVIILLLLALAAGCDVSREYSQKVFGPPTGKKQTTSSIKFLQIDSVDVSNNMTMMEADTSQVIDKFKADTIIAENKTAPVYQPAGAIRTRKVRQ